MKPIFAAMAVLTLPAMPLAAAEPAPLAAAPNGDGIPDQLDAEQRVGYRGVFQSIRNGKWIDARLQLATMKPGPLHSIALAELYTAKGSPKATSEELAALVTQAPELPQAEQLTRMAKARGMGALPTLPYTQALSWTDGAPVRARAKSTRSDDVAADLATRMQPLIKEDRAAEAQLLLEATVGLSPEALTEWQQKVAWIYYLTGDDANTRVMADKAKRGVGAWTVQAEWINGLAAWRQRDCAAAGEAFTNVASRSDDVELRSAGLYWAARADMACGRPDRIETRLKGAAQYDETFYGLLARQALGMKMTRSRADREVIAADWHELGRHPNVRVAAALIEIGETELADEVVKRQARIGAPGEFAALTRLAGSFNLASTQIWLAHNVPPGTRPSVAARYPAPNWTPDGGWRVDKALVYAHTLQESSFRTDVVSKAGAYGLMQIRPGAASDMARQRGGASDRAALRRPSTNIELGQSYLEWLRDQSCTGGLLPKVIAAYNAGATPVTMWNAVARDGGDPLLYIESIPYWETRGYVVTVLRNYWIYEREGGKAASPSRSALAQGLWPKFPGLPGAPAIRLSSNTRPVTTASAN